MRHAVLSLAFCSVLAGAVFRPSEAQVSPAKATASVQELERAWADALVSQDIQRVSGLLDARFQLVMAVNSNSANAEAYLELSKERAYKSMAPTIVNVAVNGDVAVAVVDMKVGWPDSSPSMHPTWRFTDTWIQADGKWQAVSRVAQPIPNFD
jgi:ketosteroid isomerase-like protein